MAGYTGQFSLAHHTFALIGAYCSSLLVVKAGISTWYGIVAAVVLTLIVSTILGIICLRMRGIYLALATWAFAEVVRAFLRMNYSFTGGDAGFTTPSLFGTLRPLPYYYLFFALAVVSLLIIAIIMRTRIGYYLRAIRNDQTAANSMGVDIVRWKVFAFAVSSGMAGMAGAFYGHTVGLISPILGEFNEAAMIVVFVVIGGMRTQVGPVIGALTVRFFAEIFRDWGELRMLILSLAVILIMLFFNGGMMEFLRRLGARLNESRIVPKLQIARFSDCRHLRKGKRERASCSRKNDR